MTTSGAPALSINGRPWPPNDAQLKIGLKSSRVSDPVQNPSDVYPPVPGLSEANTKFRLGAHALTDAEREQALEVVREYHDIQKSHFMGFQCNQALDYSKSMASYFDMHINNLGDPFTTGSFTMNSKFMERAVLDYYAALWNARWPHHSEDPDSYWGFALTMGSTEGNLYGMWNARDYLGGKLLLSDPSAVEQDRQASLRGRPCRAKPRLVYHQALLPKDNVNAYTPIAFYSQDTHYSLAKAMRILAIRTFYDVGRELYFYECPLEEWKGKGWPQEVPSKNGSGGPGAIDIDALAQLVEFFAKRGYPIMVCFNYGTTFKGAYDDVEAAGNKLVPILKEHGLDERKVYYDPDRPELFDVRTGYWFHVDGALGAAYMPYIEMAHNCGLVAQRGPIFDFRLPFVHSIAMSGHKWIGIPMPCGIYMTKTKLQLLPPKNPEYIGTPDTTFAGSRNGLSPMLLWYYLSRRSFCDLVRKAAWTEEMAQYTENSLRKLQDETLKVDLWVSRTPLSLTVVFKQVNSDLVFKYSLSNETLWVNGEQRKYSHVFLMEHVTKDMVDSLIDDLSKEGAFPEQEQVEAQKITHLAPHTNRRAFVPHEGRGFHG